MFDILIMMMVSQCIRGSKFFKLWNLNMCGLLQIIISQYSRKKGFLGGSCGKECLQGRRCEFEHWVVKIPWRRKWQPTPVFLPGESHGQRSLAGYSPWGHEGFDTSEHTHTPVQSVQLFKGELAGCTPALSTWRQRGRLATAGRQGAAAISAPEKASSTKLWAGS